MPLPQQRTVHLRLLGEAANVWEQHCSSSANLGYRESVAGTLQELDRNLPHEAIAAINERHDRAQIATRYREPIASLQDGDLALPAPVESAYYAIYNAFRLHVVGTKIDPWLIVNQALAAVGQEHAVAVLEAAVSG